MAKLSVREAAKRFDVSRPTLVKHLKSGKISGEALTGGAWHQASNGEGLLLVANWQC